VGIVHNVGQFRYVGIKCNVGLERDVGFGRNARLQRHVGIECHVGFISNVGIVGHVGKQRGRHRRVVPLSRRAGPGMQVCPVRFFVCGEFPALAG
jgi:hypothetical protein